MGSFKYGTAETRREGETHKQQTTRLSPILTSFTRCLPLFLPPHPSCKQFSSLVLPSLILYGLTFVSLSLSLFLILSLCHSLSLPLSRSLPLHPTPGPQHGLGSGRRKRRRRRKRRWSRVEIRTTLQHQSKFQDMTTSTAVEMGGCEGKGREVEGRQFLT